VSPPEAGRGTAWLLWIVVSVIGGVLGGLVAWRVRALLSVPAPIFVVDLLRYLATILSAAIVAGAQWLLLRRYRLDVYWWVPATVIAVLLTAIIVIPSVLRHAVDPLAAVHPRDTVIAGGAALAAAGLVIGAAQAIVLRNLVGNRAWAWIPATAIGGGLAGALTSALSSQLFGLPTFAFISLLAALGALLISATQATVLHRLLS
jgi:hypothetical protein